MSHLLIWRPKPGDRVTLLTRLPFPYRWGKRQNRGTLAAAEGANSFLVRPDHAKFEVHVLANEVRPHGLVEGLPRA